ncbi:MAG TPA: RagB/SusD family nutrient uptake outer membrane protein [Mariniphaga sp.]|nr:RagB/SusD family nutrient uptake outer membrane protein [Mariniphaga sp.]
MVLYLSQQKGHNRMIYASPEARVLRAYAYYYLIAFFGDVPFYTEPVTLEQYEDERVDRVIILDFVLDEFEEAAADLPWMASERGRVDKAVAYGLKARAALLGGSLDFGGKGAEYFRIAADAAQEVIGQRTLATNFDDLFNKTGQMKGDVRNEMLFELMFSEKGSTKWHWANFGRVSRNYGQTGKHPSQLIVDTYECIDGLRIDESPLYDPKKPFENRDPRLRSTIYMHGDTVVGNTNGTEGGRVKFVLEGFNPTTMFYNYNTETWESRNNADINSAAAWTSFVNAGVGYLWKKWTNDTIETVTNSTYNIPLLRYAEVLLNYAEAKIELDELDDSVYDAINQVRNRSGMPDVSEDRKGNQAMMRQLVRREKKVEFIDEGLHLVDMRRWRTGDIENSEPSYGYPLATEYDSNGRIIAGGYLDVTPDMIPNFNKSERHDLNDIASYEAYKDKIKVRDRNRFWEDKFYLFPIPQTERDRNPNLEQNPGY